MKPRGQGPGQVDSAACGRGRKENTGRTKQCPMARVLGSRVYPQLPHHRVPGPENTQPPVWFPVCTLTKLCCTRPASSQALAPYTNAPTRVHACPLSHLTATQHSLRLRRVGSHRLPTSGKINPSESTWHCLPLQGEGLLPPLLCLVFGFQSRQGVNTASPKP